MVKDREASGVTAHGVTKCQRWLSRWTTATHITIFFYLSDGKYSICNAGDSNSMPGSGKVPWRRKWQPTLVFLPGEFHGQRSLVGYNSWSHKELDMTKLLTLKKLSSLQNQNPTNGKCCYSSFQWRPPKARLKEPEKPIKRLPETKIKNYRLNTHTHTHTHTQALILSATPLLNHCKIPYQILPGKDKAFCGAWACPVPLCLVK